MNTALLMLALAAAVLAPDNPVLMAVLFLIACIKTWRVHALEDDDLDSSNSDCPIRCEDLPRDCDLI